MTRIFAPIAPPPDLPPAAELVTTLLDTVDVRPLALDALTQVRSIEWSEGIGTAAIECAASPRLVLNPDFVRRRCRTPEMLGALILHELAHVTLAHTRLAPQLGVLQNIAFDALINRLVAASLRTRGVDAAPYLRLFEEEYDAGVAPWFLLRPPPRWPDAPDWDASAGAPETLRALHRRLWAVPDGGARQDTLPDVTAFELLDALRTTRPSWPRTGEGARRADRGPGAPTLERADGSPSDIGAGGSGESTSDAESNAPASGAGDAHGDKHTAQGGDAAEGTDDATIMSRLLGNHGRTPAESEMLGAERDERLRESALSRAMPESRLLAGLEGASSCGIGSPSLGSLHLAKDQGRRETVRALERVFARALESGDARRRGVMGETTVLSPLWDQDRRAWGRRRFAAHFGQPAPALFPRTVASPAPVPTRVAVYLDVSGSMWSVLPPLHDVLCRLRRRADVRLWQWSDAVVDASGAWWRDRAIETSGGTNIECVLRHALTQARRVRRIVILTDGILPAPSPRIVAEVRQAGVTMHLALVGFDGVPAPRHTWAATATDVPAWTRWGGA